MSMSCYIPLHPQHLPLHPQAYLSPGLSYAPGIFQRVDTINARGAHSRDQGGGIARYYISHYYHDNSHPKSGSTSFLKSSHAT